MMVGLRSGAERLSLKGYFKPFNFAIIWEVMGIGKSRPVSNRSCSMAASC
ncbi:hypothetical protein LNP17_20565 [Klebsiella variicola subsp. variicola]|nr:hypothetical protein [Klebsiella variicola subsp. variicola]